MKAVQGENWGVFGKMNTGKTHTTLVLGLLLHLLYEKKVIIFDHANNLSYQEYDNEIDLEDLHEIDSYPNGIYKVIGSDDYELFCDIATTHVHHSVIILDDCGNYFQGNLTDIQMKFVKATKNNMNDVFFQCHDVADIAPKLLRSLQMIVIKEQSLPEIPKKQPKAQQLQWLHDEVIAENNKGSKDKLWSFRIYDLNRDQIYTEGDEPYTFEQFDGRDYFKKYLKRR